MLTGRPQTIGRIYAAIQRMHRWRADPNNATA
jgi:hypothetical protein